MVHAFTGRQERLKRARKFVVRGLTACPEFTRDRPPPSGREAYFPLRGCCGGFDGSREDRCGAPRAASGTV